MKCQSCSQKWPQKNGMRCSCGHYFTFNPKLDGFSDGKFAAAIRSASRNDSIYFTGLHIYTALCLTLLRKTKISLIIGIISLLLSIIFLIFAIIPVVMFSGFVSFACLISFFSSKNQVKKITPEVFNKALNRWKKNNKLSDKFIKKTNLSKPPPKWKETDIYDYGVEKILIVQEDIQVDLFVLNNFHIEQRALIISANSYPDYLIHQAKEIIKENSRIPVYLLHDSSARGDKMIASLYNDKLFSMAGKKIIDLGLEPDDMKRMKPMKPLSNIWKEQQNMVEYIPYVFLSQLISESFTQIDSFSNVLPIITDSGGMGDFG
jgi:hypothetical protein